MGPNHWPTPSIQWRGLPKLQAMKQVAGKLKLELAPFAELDMEIYKLCNGVSMLLRRMCYRFHVIIQKLLVLA